MYSKHLAKYGLGNKQCLAETFRLYNLLIPQKKIISIHLCGDVVMCCHLHSVHTEHKACVFYKYTHTAKQWSINSIKKSYFL